MTQLTHQSFSHMNKKPSAGPSPNIPVHTVAPPDMEQELLAHQTVQAPANPSNNVPELPQMINNGIPGIMDDKAVQANLDRKKIFEKLVLFREDHTTEVSLGGLNFRLKLLNANDNSFVLKQIKKIPEDEQMSKLTLMILAAAIVDVDGIKLEDVYSGPAELTDPVMRRYYELNLWSSPVVAALEAAYNKFQSTVQKEYGKDFFPK